MDVKAIAMGAGVTEERVIEVHAREDAAYDREREARKKLFSSLTTEQQITAASVAIRRGISNICGLRYYLSDYGAKRATATRFGSDIDDILRSHFRAKLFLHNLTFFSAAHLELRKFNLVPAVAQWKRTPKPNQKILFASDRPFFSHSERAHHWLLRQTREFFYILNRYHATSQRYRSDAIVLNSVDVVNPVLALQRFLESSNRASDWLQYASQPPENLGELLELERLQALLMVESVKKITHADPHRDWDDGLNSQKETSKRKRQFSAPTGNKSKAIVAKFQDGLDADAIAVELKCLPDTVKTVQDRYPHLCVPTPRSKRTSGKPSR